MLLALQKIRRGRPCRSLGPAIEREIDGLYDLVVDLSRGVGPKKDDVNQYSNFYKEASLCLPNFFSFTFVSQEVIEGVVTEGPKELKGVAAIQCIFRDLWEKAEKDLAFAMGQIKPLKTYQDLLNDIQVKQMQQMIQKCKPVDPGSGMVAIENVAEHAVVLASSSSSSSSCVPKAPLTKKAAAKVTKEGLKQQEMLKFFMPKSKAAHA